MNHLLFGNAEDPGLALYLSVERLKKAFGKNFGKEILDFNQSEGRD